MTIQFTGRERLAFGRSLAATCVVRNELNKWRKSDQVVITLGQTTPHGLPYQPRQFPAGEWEITRVADMPKDSEFWPIFMDTDATQMVRIWSLDDDGNYYGPTYRWITGRGFGIHHARYPKAGQMVKSNTTIGCINILSPDDAQWLGEQVREATGRVYIDIPPWNKWA